MATHEVRESTVDNILYNMAEPMPEEKYCLSVWVDDEPGILARISGLLAGAARAFNIESLSVAGTGVPGLSRMTIVLLGDSRKKDQAEKQLRDQVNVWAVVDAQSNSLKREMVLVKVSTFPPEHVLSAENRAKKGEEQPLVVDYEGIMDSHSHREAVTALAKLFDAEVVDVGTNQIILELVSWSRRIDAFLRAAQPFGIIEVARSGPIAMRRSEVFGGWAESTRSPTHIADLSALPPS